MAKTIFRYPGGKSRQAEMLLSYMPSGVQEYREPFVGGGGVFFGLDSRKVQTRWINDLNDGLIAVYMALRDRTSDFIEKCRSIAPPTQGEEEVSTKGTGKKYNKRLGEVFELFKYNAEMDQALRYFFLNRTIWAGRVNYDPAFSSRMYYSNPSGWNAAHKRGLLEEAAKHLSGVKITALDFEQIMDAEGDNVCLYIDPPYMVDTKLSRMSKLYQYGFDVETHERFVAACKRSKHKLCISYDDVPEVRDWFKGFNIYEHSWKYSGTSNDKKVDGKELVITNY